MLPVRPMQNARPAQCEGREAKEDLQPSKRLARGE